MPELTREEKLKLVEKLPQQLQDFLYSEDTGAALLYFGQKYNLPDEKVRLLSKLVVDVVLKIIPITSLAQEINSKIISDAQAAMNLAQELNTELLAPAMVSAPLAPATLAPTPAPAALKTTSPTPPYQGVEKREVVDEYREPTSSVPEIVDLRKTPPAVSKVEPPPAPVFTPKPVPPTPAPAPTPATVPVPTPTPKPIIPAPPLIEAEPHKIPPPEPKPQYIMRPSGAPPTDLPENVLDLRKDKGEF